MHRVGVWNLEFSSELQINQRQIQERSYDVENSANPSFYEAMRDGQMVHLASPWSSFGPIIHPHLHFCLFLQISGCTTSIWSFMGDLRWSVSVVLTLFGSLPPPVPTTNANKACSNLTWTETEHRRIVSSRQKAAQKSRLPHQSSLVLCFFGVWLQGCWGGRSVEGMPGIWFLPGISGPLKGNKPCRDYSSRHLSSFYLWEIEVVAGSSSHWVGRLLVERTFTMLIDITYNLSIK